MSDNDLIMWGAIGGVVVVSVLFAIFLSVILLAAWKLIREGGEYFERENRRARIEADESDEALGMR